MIVPASHDIGSLDQDASGSNEKYYKLENHASFSNIDALKTEISKNQFPEIIVFVHGFNVKFEEAVLRAAQIKYDLKFAGEVVLFSWPAGSEDGVLSQLLIKGTYQNLYLQKFSIKTRNYQEENSSNCSFYGSSSCPSRCC